LPDSTSVAAECLAGIETEWTSANSRENISAVATIYGWHPRSVAVALANLRYLQRHRRSLLENANRIGEYVRTRLSQLKFEGKATVRGKGLAIGIEVESEDWTSFEKSLRAA